MTFLKRMFAFLAGVFATLIVFQPVMSEVEVWECAAWIIIFIVLSLMMEVKGG